MARGHRGVLGVVVARKRPLCRTGNRDRQGFPAPRVCEPGLSGLGHRTTRARTDPFLQSSLRQRAFGKAGPCVGGVPLHGLRELSLKRGRTPAQRAAAQPTARRHPHRDGRQPSPRGPPTASPAGVSNESIQGLQRTGSEKTAYCRAVIRRRENSVLGEGPPACTSFPAAFMMSVGCWVQDA